MKVNLPNGESFTYEAPTIKVQEYTGDEIFQKRLLLFIPYYLMRYKKQLEDENCDAAELDEIAEEFGEILNRLDANLAGRNGDGDGDDGRKHQQEKEYECLVKLTERIMKYVTRKSGDARERIGGVMGGKVLDLDCEEVKGLKKERRNIIIKMVQSGMPEKDILFYTDCDMGELDEIRQQIEG